MDVNDLTVRYICQYKLVQLHLQGRRDVGKEDRGL